MLGLRNDEARPGFDHIMKTQRGAVMRVICSKIRWVGPIRIQDR